jgi:hypothetical protein
MEIGMLSDEQKCVQREIQPHYVHNMRKKKKKTKKKKKPCLREGKRVMEPPRSKRGKQWLLLHTTILSSLFLMPTLINRAPSLGKASVLSRSDSGKDEKNTWSGESWNLSFSGSL